MIYTRGQLLARVGDTGTDDLIRITAVRRAPIEYAEVEPAAGGGLRKAVPLPELDRDYVARSSH